MFVDKIELQSQTQESNKDIMKNVSTVESIVSDIISKILNSIDLTEKIGIMEKGQDSCKGKSQTKDKKKNAKLCEKISKRSLNEFHKIANILSEMRMDNEVLHKKLSLKKICQMLERMSLHDSETAELSNNSGLRQLALETDIIIGKLKKIEKKPNISETEILKKVKIIYVYGLEKIFRILRVLIKQLNKEGKHKI